MTQMERIEIKKIFVGRAAMFGLFYGLVLGIIVGIFFFIVTSFAVDFLNNISVPGATGNIPSTTGGILFASFILIVIYTLGSCFGSAVFALLYNLVAKMGFSIHLGLAELGNFQYGGH